MTTRTPPVSEALFDFEALFDADDYLHFYEDTLASEDAAGQVSFLDRELDLRAPMKILDLGCGHGRHANELSARGHEVVGIDLVKGFWDRAAADAARRGLSAQYIHGDYRDLPWAEEFDRAICMFDAFGFFRDEENMGALAGVARALKPSGMFCLDIRNRDWMVRNILPTTVLEKGDDLMIDRHFFDTATGRLVDRRILVRGGVVKHLPFSIRLYSFSEIGLLLGAVGLRVVAAYGDFGGAPVSMQQNRMIVISQKGGA
jgi:SAM-dependent methyltransferase